MVRVFRLTVAIVSLCLCGHASWGLTRTFYYVGAPAQILNVPADEHALFNTGYLTITTDASTLSGRSVECDIFNDTCSNGDRVSKEMHFNKYVDYPNNIRIDFDMTGFLSEWSFTYGCYAPCYGGAFDSYRSAKYAFDGTGDLVQFGSEDYDIASSIARDHLTALGYIPGTRAYEALFCGSWAGPNERCEYFAGDVVGMASYAWITLLRAPVGGRWYDNPLDFADAVQANTILALANPAKSYNDIAPVPLPASLLFLGSGVLALLRIGQRRMLHA